MENSSKVKVVKIPEDMPKFEVEIHGCQCKIFQSGHDKIDWKSRVVNFKKKMDILNNRIFLSGEDIKN